MKNSSIKNPSATRLAIAAILITPSLFASSRPHFDTRMELNSRLAYHLSQSQDLASHRHILEFDQKFKWGAWQGVAGIRAFTEIAFVTNQRYESSVPRNEAGEIAANDIYLQYKDSDWLVKLGNQQVVWGEAFGFYFADVVNPKDARDFGLGDMNKQRICVPMLNAKYMLNHASFQLIYIPKPYFNRLPAQGTDFAPNYAALFPQGTLRVSDSRTVPLAFSNGELGLRATSSWNDVDWAAFYFYHHDRAPSYRFNLTNVAPLEATLEGFHPRVHTVGITATTEREPFLLRAEALATWDKVIDANTTAGYLNFKTNEYIGVLGVDYTKINNWRLGVQVSENYFSRHVEGSFSPKHRPMLTLHAQGPVFREQSIEAILSHIMNDGSTLLQLRYLVPVSSRIEILFGGDIFFGGAQSQFGRFENASRGYVLLKGYLMGT